VRAGLLALSWAEDSELPDPAQLSPVHHALAARLLMSLAHFESEQGRTGYGLQLLDRAEPLAAPADRGVLLSQRGLLNMRAWRGEAARAQFDEAEALLRDYPDPSYLARTLLNRSFLHLNTGDVRRARADVVRCERVSAEHGLTLMTAKALHNRGYCELLTGDLPAALQLFNAAAEIYRQQAPSALPVLAMDKARALLSAGLAAEAAQELDGAISAFRRQRLDQDHAEAELARAQAALAAGDLAGARRWAAAARRRFHRRGNEACASLAELTRLRAQAMIPGRPAVIAAQARLIAGRLRDSGLARDAYVADLIEARALMTAGRVSEARQRIAATRRGQTMTLEASLLRRLAQADLAEQEGHRGAAFAELRAGLRLLHARRGRLGSVDLQTSSAALGADLAAAGLRLALERGSAPLVFAWLERSRAQAFRVRPVRPPADPRAALLLAELRQLSYLIRQSELNGRRDRADIARCAQLQRELREHSWTASGKGSEGAQPRLSDVVAALAETGQCMACLLSQGGQLLAVLLGAGAVQLLSLGRYDVAAEGARRLTADLDMLAGPWLPARMEAVVRESVMHQTEALDAQIITPLRSSLAEGGLVVVPTRALAGIPWGLLPSLHGYPVTVSPSAATWLAASRRCAGDPHGGRPPVLVAGPDLRHAAREITEIASAYPGCRPLLSDAATVGATLAALDGAPLAHLAAHGHHDYENFLFSRLDLADGPLMAYDIQGLSVAPGQVILSACDVGRTVVRPGEEVLGFTAALLYAGTATAISSVTRVADDLAMSTMSAYHRELRAGVRPAAALSAAAAGSLSPFVCFGSG
jgi:tetratricopeptide (TPR) repeat protein